MRRMGLGILTVMVLGASAAACAQQAAGPGGTGETSVPDDGAETSVPDDGSETAAPSSIVETVNDYCDDSQEFRDAVTADPSNTDLFDVGEPLYERGTELLQEEIPQSNEDPATTDELLEKTGKCQDTVVSGLADIEAG